MPQVSKDVAAVVTVPMPAASDSNIKFIKKPPYLIITLTRYFQQKRITAAAMIKVPSQPEPEYKVVQIEERELPTH